MTLPPRSSSALKELSSAAAATDQSIDRHFEELFSLAFQPTVKTISKIAITPELSKETGDRIPVEFRRSRQREFWAR